MVTVTFNKPVCRVALFNQATWQVSFNAINDPVFGDTIPICNVAADNGVASASLFIQGPPPVGSLVAAGGAIALAPDALARAVLAGTAVVIFAVGVWRFVLDDAERAGLRLLLT